MNPGTTRNCRLGNGGSPDPERTHGQQTGEAQKYNSPRRVGGKTVCHDSRKDGTCSGSSAVEPRDGGRRFESGPEHSATDEAAPLYTLAARP